MLAGREHRDDVLIFDYVFSAGFGGHHKHLIEIHVFIRQRNLAALLELPLNGPR